MTSINRLILLRYLYGKLALTLSGDALERAKTELCKKSDHDLFLLCLHVSQRDPAAVRAAVTVCGNQS